MLFFGAEGAVAHERVRRGGLDWVRTMIDVFQDSVSLWMYDVAAESVVSQACLKRTCKLFVL